MLRGLGGRDMLLGGLGRDVLRGGGDNDLLVGGHVNTTFSYQRQRNLADAWGQTPQDSGGVSQELTALFQATTDEATTAEYDQLFGGLGRDALLYRQLGVKDKTDFSATQDVRRFF